MPYYHATFRKHIPSILKHGLGGRVTEQNWDGCEPGVYLAAEPEVCIFVMLDQYYQFGHPDSVPRDHLAEIVVIVIDDSRVQPAKLGPDPLIKRRDVWLYDGVIDVTSMPVVDLLTMVSEFTHSISMSR